MKNRITVLIIMAFVSTLTLLGYLYYRYPQIESEQLKKYQLHADSFLVSYKNYLAKTGIRPEQHRTVFEHMLNKDETLAMVTGIDSYNNLVNGERNRKIIAAKRIYNQIIGTLLTNKTSQSPMIQVLNSNYYTHTITTAAFTLYLIYSFEIERNLMLQLIFESILAAALMTSLIFFIFTLAGKKRGKKSSSYQQTNITVSNCEHSIDINGSDNLNTLISEDEDGNLNETIDTIRNSRVTPIATHANRTKQIRNFESYIFNIFNRISIQYQINSLSLYLLDNSSISLKKIFELYGRAFVKTTAQNSLETESSKDLINALADNSLIIRNSGCKTIVPVFNDGELLGAVYIINKTPVNGTTCSIIRKELAQLGSYLMIEILKTAV